MTKKFLILLAVMMLVLAAGAAWAVPTISIDDSLEGAPTVGKSGFSLNPVVLTADELANVTGTLTANFLTAGIYGARMFEVGGGVSDFAILQVLPKIPLVNTQLFNLTFLSDGALDCSLPVLGNFSGFDLALAAYLAGIGSGVVTELTSITENGNWQTLFNFTGLVVKAKSDAPVPVPASVILLGSGVLALGLPALLRRRKA